MKPPTLPNPAQPRALKPAHLITDRAKRYRANRAIVDGPRICGYCGRRGKVRDIDHIDGHEANGQPQNLMYACRSCNAAKGNIFAKLGLGKRTRQYNPQGKRGALTYNEWTWATKTVTGKQPATPEEIRHAASLIAHTDPSRRSFFANQIWDIRRERYGVPF